MRLERTWWQAWRNWLGWSLVPTHLTPAAAAGQHAENQACRHLQAAGLHILARNVRCKGGELDIICRDHHTIVFVEVRYRAHSTFGGAAASISAAKQARIRHCAQAYLLKHPLRRNQGCRFDVVTIEGTAPHTRLTWFPQAFY